MKIEEQEVLLQAAQRGFEILRTKRADYTGTSDVLDIFKTISLETGISASQLIKYEISKKKHRIYSLQSKETINHESIEDNLIDIMNYYFLLSCLELEEFCRDTNICRYNSDIPTLDEITRYPDALDY